MEDQGVTSLAFKLSGSAHQKIGLSLIPMVLPWEIQGVLVEEEQLETPMVNGLAGMLELLVPPLMLWQNFGRWETI